MASGRSFLALIVATAAILMLAAAAVVIRGAAAKTQSVDELQEKFDHEDNAVRKAKLLQKLGDAQFEALHAAERAEDYNSVGMTLEKYRDNVRTVLAELKKQHPDAERQSNGYRQLQMHVDRGVREVDEALLTAPEEFRPPLQLVRADLGVIDDELLRLLFPRQPNAKPDAKSDKEVKP